MILIAHRGNIDGRNEERENSPDYLVEAIDAGFHVETDIWVTQRMELMLGHDYPKYNVTLKFLKTHSNKLIFHAKNAAALDFLLLHNFHCFSHDQDERVLTSKGLVWAFPDKELTPMSICVMPELSSCAGICSDYVRTIEKVYKHEKEK